VRGGERSCGSSSFCRVKCGRSRSTFRPFAEDFFSKKRTRVELSTRGIGGFDPPGTLSALLRFSTHGFIYDDLVSRWSVSYPRTHLGHSVGSRLAAQQRQGSHSFFFRFHFFLFFCCFFYFFFISKVSFSQKMKHL
jgi:hypothetical protein